jgi:hypothetical protein
MLNSAQLQANIQAGGKATPGPLAFWDGKALKDGRIIVRGKGDHDTEFPCQVCENIRFFVAAADPITGLAAVSRELLEARRVVKVEVNSSEHRYCSFCPGDVYPLPRGEEWKFCPRCGHPLSWEAV